MDINLNISYLQIKKATVAQQIAYICQADT